MSEMSEKVSLSPRKNHWKHLDDVKVEAGKKEKQEFWPTKHGIKQGP